MTGSQFQFQDVGDKATVVSMYPFKIHDFKPGLVPNTFDIPAADVAKGEMQLFPVSAARFPVYLDAQRGSIWVTVPALILAQSIVFDYVTAKLGYENGEGDENDLKNYIPGSKPAIFFVPGTPNKVEILEKYKARVELAKAEQINWFRKLITIADDDFTRYKQHRLITGLQRYAANYLNLDREWSVNITPEDFKPCLACGNRIRKEAIRCEHCGTVLDAERFKKLNLAMQ